MNIKSFFVATLSSALDLGIATPDDVLRHVTPDVLAQHLPRPLWARLFTAALGAPRTDAQLVVETIGVPNLCEHIPSPIIWGCIADVAQRALGGGIAAAPVAHAVAAPPPAAKAAPLPIATPPPPEVRPTTPARGTPLPTSPSIPRPADPLADVVAALESDERSPAAASAASAASARAASGSRFRQSNTGIGRLATPSARRPQAQATPPADPKARRTMTEADALDVETEVKDKEDWKSSLAVEDEQLVDWSAESTTTGDEYRKR